LPLRDVVGWQRTARDVWDLEYVGLVGPVVDAATGDEQDGSAHPSVDERRMQKTGAAAAAVSGRPCTAEAKDTGGTVRGLAAPDIAAVAVAVAVAVAAAVVVAAVVVAGGDVAAAVYAAVQDLGDVVSAEKMERGSNSFCRRPSGL